MAGPKTKKKTTPDYTGMGIGFMNKPKYNGDKIGKKGYSQPISSKQYTDELIEDLGYYGKKLSNVNVYAVSPKIYDKINPAITENQLNYFSGKDLTSDYPFSIDRYEKIWNGWENSGKPSIYPVPYNENDERMQDRARFYPDFNMMKIIPNDINDYFAELSHAHQLSKGTWNNDDFKKYPNPNDYDRYAYSDPSTREYDAHSIIQPRLTWEQNVGDVLTDKEIKKRAKLGDYTGSLTSTDIKKIEDVITKNFMKRNKNKHPEGGVVMGKPKDKKLEVYNNVWTPQTRHSIYPLLAKAGMVGHGADSLTLDQWNKLKPEDTIKYMDTDKGFDYTKGNTANPGGIKYWSMDVVPNIYNYVPSSKHYMAQKGEKYFSGGQVLSGVGGILGAIPTPWTQIAGAGLNLLGGFVGANEQQKLLDKQNAQKTTLTQMGAGNNYTDTFAFGGLTPYGTDIEVQRGEVLQDPNNRSLLKISDKAPTHAQGGVDITAKPGTKIYGNLRIKDGKYAGLTYQEAADKISKQLEKYTV